MTQRQVAKDKLLYIYYKLPWRRHNENLLIYSDKPAYVIMFLKNEVSTSVPVQEGKFYMDSRIKG